MAAGRASLEAVKRNHIVLNGKNELQRRFGAAVLTASWEWREEAYWVDVTVLPADGGDLMCFTEALKVFPSDECIANIALVT